MSKTFVSLSVHYNRGETPTPSLKHFASSDKSPEFWSLRLDGISGPTIVFHTAEQLQAFDESLHGDIEDALFRHVHGVSEEVAELAKSSEREGAS